MTVKDIIEKDKRLDIPTSLEVLRTAQRATTGAQLGFDSVAYLSAVPATEEPLANTAPLTQAETSINN